MLSVGQQPTKALSNSSLLIKEGISFFPGIGLSKKSDMPQLDKFTYFTQFFSLCLLSGICLGRKSDFKIESKLYLFYVRNEALGRLLLFCKVLFVLAIIIRSALLLWTTNWTMLLFQNSIFGVGPAEWALIDSYLSQPYQDPEWVDFVHKQLGRSPAAELSTRFQSFMDIELATSTRQQILEFFRIIYFNHTDPLLWIPPDRVDLIVRAHLEALEFHFAALCDVLDSLCIYRHHAPFYTQVVTDKADIFQFFLEESRQRELQRTQKFLELEEYLQLEKSIERLQKENAALREHLFS